MIAAVKGWHAVLTALLVWVPRAALAAEDPGGAARELAGKTSTFAGSGVTVSVSYRNLSSLGAAEFGQVRAAFEGALRQTGGRIGESASSVEVRITVSENPSQYLLVEEARKGDDRQVWMATWKRSEQTVVKTAAISLDKKLIWEQDEQLLDVGFPAGGLLLLAPSKVSFLVRQKDRWELRQTRPLAAPRAWPRDLRGRLQITGNRFRAFLPGMNCTGTVDPELAMDCRPSEEPWLLELGSRALMLATFAPARNYFDGHTVTQGGTPRTVPAFFSGAAVEDRGQTLWVLQLVDGRTQVFDGNSGAASAPTSFPSWGSDIAGIESHCGAKSQILATRPGEGEPDAIQSWSLIDRQPAAVTEPVSFPGPVTAMWSSGGNSVLVVARDLETGKYAAYALTVACGS